MLLFQRKPENILFGVDPLSIKSVDDPFTDLIVPSPLLSLKNELLRVGGFRKERIFSMEGDPVHTRRLKQKLNMNEQMKADQEDFHCVASLIKVFIIIIIVIANIIYNLVSSLIIIYRIIITFPSSVYAILFYLYICISNGIANFHRES